MGADKGKKQKVGELEEENNVAEKIDGELVLSIEKLQEIQDELEKVILFFSFLFLILISDFYFLFTLPLLKKLRIFQENCCCLILKEFLRNKNWFFLFSHIFGWVIS